MDKAIIYLSIYSLLIVSLFVKLYSRPIDDIIDPELYMNNKLSEAQQLKVKIHSSHHSSKDIKKMVQKLENGSSWHEAHALLKPMGYEHHIKHIDIEMMSLFIQSLTLTTGLLFAYAIQSTFDYLKPKNIKLTLWYNFLTFTTTILLFSTFIMISKHYMSFRTFNEKLFF
jgi:hypothetical protein